MQNHGTALTIGQFAEFVSAVIKALPRDINPETALEWARNGQDLERALRGALALGGLDQKIVNALIEGKFIDRKALDAAVAKAKAANRPLREVFLEEKMVDPETLSTVMSFILNVPVVKLRGFRIQPEALALVPKNVAQKLGVLPLSVEGDTLRVAMEDPQDVRLIDTLAGLTRKRIRPVLPLRGGLKEAIEAAYSKVSPGA